ncbi:MAG: hypothetical protein WBF53_16485 [Litorimonas sp.]
MNRITSLTETGMRITPSTGHYVPVDDYFLVDESQDLRGRDVTRMLDSKEIEHVGVVADMLVDPDTREVAIIELKDGRRYPIEMVRLRGSQVRLEG